VTGAEWWECARARWTGGEPLELADVLAYTDLDPDDRRRIKRRMDDGLRHEDPNVRTFAWRVAEDVAVATMDTAPLSDHLRLEVAAIFHRGRALDPGDPVPGCGCEICTGIPADSPARLPAWRRRDPDRAARTDQERREAWERGVETARAVSVLDVARLLGCGDPVKRGRELAVRCPLHDDSDPSLRIAAEGHTWYCDPCGEGGDAIALYMRGRRINFTDAVRELAA